MQTKVRLLTYYCCCYYYCKNLFGIVFYHWKNVIVSARKLWLIRVKHGLKLIELKCMRSLAYMGFIIIIMTRRQLRSVATTLHDDRDPVPSSTPV